MTLTIEHKRIFARFLRTSYSLNYKEFSALLALAQASQKVSSRVLADFLALEHSATLAMLIKLEERNLVTKTESGEVLQVRFFTASEQGKTLAKEAVFQLDHLMRTTLWDSLPVDEFQQIMKSEIKSSVDALRGHPVEVPAKCLLDESCITADFLIFWRILIEGWASIVKRQSSLSLSEYRILGLLADLGPISLQKACDRLVICRSRTSLYKDNLNNRGFLEQENNSEDGRSIILTLTPQGRQLVGKIRDSIAATTYPEEATMPQGEDFDAGVWHVRMYNNLKKVKNGTEHALFYEAPFTP